MTEMNSSYGMRGIVLNECCIFLFSALHCWLGDRKGVWPVETNFSYSQWICFKGMARLGVTVEWNTS